MYSSSIFLSERFFSTPEKFIVNQLFFVLIGSILFFFITKIPYQIYNSHFIFILLLVSFILLIIVVIPTIGVKVSGARRWIKFGAIGFQPSEFLKITLVIWIAYFLTKKSDVLQNFTKTFLPICSILFIFSFLLLLEPDFGLVTLLIFQFIVMIVLAGGRILHILLFLFFSAIMGAILIISNPYRVRRIIAFLDPWETQYEGGYQLVNSLIATGSGGFLGKGIGNSIQKQFFLPQAHTDFIFAVIAEETGSWGIFLLLLLFFIFMQTGLKIADNSRDTFGKNLALSITTMLTLQFFFHTCVVIGLLPTKGIGLPFISYGGSSFLTYVVMSAILFNIAKSSYRDTYSRK